MAEWVRRMIWCNACFAENWSDTSWLLDEKQATVRSGALRIRAWCRSCDVELPPGSAADAVTIHHGRPDAAEWADGYLQAAAATKTEGEV